MTGWILSSHVGESLHTKICTNTISYGPSFIIPFFGPGGFATVNEQMYYPLHCRCCSSLCSSSPIFSFSLFHFTYYLCTSRMSSFYTTIDFNVIYFQNVQLMFHKRLELEGSGQVVFRLHLIWFWDLATTTVRDSVRYFFFIGIIFKLLKSWKDFETLYITIHKIFFRACTEIFAYNPKTISVLTAIQLVFSLVSVIFSIINLLSCGRRFNRNQTKWENWKNFLIFEYVALGALFVLVDAIIT